MFVLEKTHLFDALSERTLLGISTADCLRPTVLTVDLVLLHFLGVEELQLAANAVEILLMASSTPERPLLCLFVLGLLMLAFSALEKMLVIVLDVEMVLMALLVSEEVLLIFLPDKTQY